MIAYLKGIIIEVQTQKLIIEVGGIGYEVFIAHSEEHERVQIGKSILVYIFEHIKEDAHDLYGFFSKEEKELFKRLISVSGIGPKAGMNFLSLYTPAEIVDFIIEGNTKALSKVSGIGAKTAQRVVLELKENMLDLKETDIERYVQTGSQVPHANKDEAIEALIALGYQTEEATKAVKAIYTSNETVENLISKALRLLAI